MLLPNKSNSTGYNCNGNVNLLVLLLKKTWFSFLFDYVQYRVQFVLREFKIIYSKKILSYHNIWLIVWLLLLQLILLGQGFNYTCGWLLLVWSDVYCWQYRCGVEQSSYNVGYLLLVTSLVILFQIIVTRIFVQI